jgi:hypothetical protein
MLPTTIISSITICQSVSVLSLGVHAHRSFSDSSESSGREDSVDDDDDDTSPIASFGAVVCVHGPTIDNTFSPLTAALRAHTGDKVYNATAAGNELVCDGLTRFISTNTHCL